MISKPCKQAPQRPLDQHKDQDLWQYQRPKEETRTCGTARNPETIQDRQIRARQIKLEPARLAANNDQAAVQYPRLSRSLAPSAQYSATFRRQRGSIGGEFGERKLKRPFHLVIYRSFQQWRRLYAEPSARPAWLSSQYSTILLLHQRHDWMCTSMRRQVISFMCRRNHGL